MRTLLLNVLLAIAWMFLVGRAQPRDFIVGYLIGFVVILAVNRVTPDREYARGIAIVTGFILRFLRELVIANVQVAIEVLRPRPRIQPGFIKLPLDVESDAEITLLASVISLTPGTLSVDISDDRKTLYVHAMWASDPDRVRALIKSAFERRILEARQ